MKKLKATHYINGKRVNGIETNSESKLRHFFSRTLPRSFNSIAHCACMIKELNDGNQSAERRWRQVREIHKLTLERQ